jgi:hypothetical protein
MVTAIAALVKHFNPDLRALDVIRLLKQTASRPAGTAWTPELGWGIVNPVAALSAARVVDRHAPSSSLRGPNTVRSARSVTLRLSGVDAPVAAGVVAAGVARYEIWRSTNRGAYKRVKTTTAARVKLKVRRGSRYRFYSIAVDKVGNREGVPGRPDLSMRVSR